MTLFYTGTHVLQHAPYLERAFINVRVLRSKNRRSDIRANCWIMDSGAFRELEIYGEFRTSVEQYASEIKRWSQFQGFELAVTQDYMCEPFMVARTGLSVAEHQRLTIQRYDALARLVGADALLPVLQGYSPAEYVLHLADYGERLAPSIRVGVGSVCKRNNNPQVILDVLEAIKTVRPDLRLHGFGLKKTALENARICSLLYSADSMAWSLAARRNHDNANGLHEAITYTEHVQSTMGKRGQQLKLGRCTGVTHSPAGQ